MTFVILGCQLCLVNVQWTVTSMPHYAGKLKGGAMAWSSEAAQACMHDVIGSPHSLQGQHNCLVTTVSLLALAECCRQAHACAMGHNADHFWHSS